MASGSGWNMGVVSRRWVWVESMAVASGCSCKEVYRFYHITYPYTSRAAKNSDFVRVIGFFNPPLRVRTDIYAINDLFGLWTRYKIGINLNYSDTSHFAHAHGTS